jgi:hypothetical protein
MALLANQLRAVEFIRCMIVPIQIWELGEQSSRSFLGNDPIFLQMGIIDRKSVV